MGTFHGRGSNVRSLLSLFDLTQARLFNRTDEIYRGEVLKEALDGEEIIYADISK